MLSVKVHNLKLKNPVMTASGTFGYGEEFADFIDLNRLGGFIVKGTDTASFLEEKLATLGLTEREAEEFIVYWLPKLEANKYNLIRFETAEEITKNMPLSVYPEPDTLIRVMMDYKPLEEEVDIKEQALETPTRDGFVVVEWGGSQL